MSPGQRLMAVSERPRVGVAPVPCSYPHAASVGPVGRLGRYTATHLRVVLIGWPKTRISDHEEEE